MNIKEYRESLMVKDCYLCANNLICKHLMTCKQCGSDDDYSVLLTKNQICGKCTCKNHKKAVGK